jgi:hypothetical protein
MQTMVRQLFVAFVGCRLLRRSLARSRIGPSRLTNSSTVRDNYFWTAGDNLGMAAIETTPAPFQFSIDSISEPFVGRWHTLVSTTNWEKGRIIYDWRQQRIAEGLDASHYSDEAWANMVGNVTSQHVGRLRRVAERFGERHREYDGLYWSHFHAALDWTDAEMWLEGALQKGWSVSQMRRARQDANEGPAEAYPAATDIIEQTIEAGDYHLPDADGDFDVTAEVGQVIDPDHDSPPPSDMAAAERATPEPLDETPRERPLANLPELPEDVAEAFEQFKLAVLHHKIGGWQQISCDELLATLDALRSLALSPSGE